MNKCVVAAIALLVAGVTVPPARGQECNTDVCVRIDPADITVDINVVDTFTLDIVADIQTPVVGWGLDLDIQTPDVVSIFGDPDIPNPPWVPVTGEDDDGLAAVANPFPPTNGSVSGPDVLLATLTFSVDGVGETDLVLGITDGDLTEGFPLDPFGFGTVTFDNGHVEVVPEAGSLLLLASGLPLLTRRRKRQPGGGYMSSS